MAKHLLCNWGICCESEMPELFDRKRVAFIKALFLLVSDSIMKAKTAKAIRRTCRRHSQCRENMGVSELFLAPPSHVSVILDSHDIRLKCYLLGYDNIPPKRI
jgi:hypothetical protein